MKWESETQNGDKLSGVCGGSTHIHELGFENGVITNQVTGDHIPYDNSVREINELLSQNPNFPKL